MPDLTCPVCGYDHLEFPPANFSICACCGTEFGYDDRVLTHGQLTQRWIAAGFPWFDINEQKPIGWNPYKQLIDAHLGGYLPTLISYVVLQSDVTVGGQEIELGPILHVPNPYEAQAA